MTAPFMAPNRNAGYQATKQPYENQWAASAREHALKQAAASAKSNNPSISKVCPKIEDTKSQNQELKDLAKKTPKQVREWLREQIEALDDSSDD